MANFWNDEKIVTLKRLWAEGHSARLIAMRINAPSRSAVIGKVHRLGLSGRVTHVRVRNRAPSVPKKRQRFAKPITFPLRAVLPPLPEVDTPKGPLVAFADLDRHHCRASYGDPQKEGFGFCGCRVVPGTSYCEDHVRRYYQAVPVRTRRAPVTCIQRLNTRLADSVTTDDREDVLA